MVSRRTDSDKIKYVSPYTHGCPMRWGDMDVQGHINNAAYPDYLQEARVAFLLSGSPVLHQLLDSGVLVVSHQVEYLKPVAFSEQPLVIGCGWMPSGAAGSRSATKSLTATIWPRGREQQLCHLT